MASGIRSRTLLLLLLLSAVALALGLGACGASDEGEAGELRANLIAENPANRDVEITVGSKNFTEQFILGEIYAQALRAAGYTVDTRLNLGQERAALRALRDGEVDAYPEYTSTALTSFFGIPSDKVPDSAQSAYEQSRADFSNLGLTAFPPTPFSSANGVGLLTERADQLDITSISQLQDVSKSMTLYGSPECRRRADCLVGLERSYGLRFKKFVPVEIDRRYSVLDSGAADLSILFTTDAQLFVSDEYVILDDDRGVLPPGNVLFLARRQTAKAAGPDFAATIESVQSELTLELMQELNARVDVDGLAPAQVARSYLEDFGYVR